MPRRSMVDISDVDLTPAGHVRDVWVACGVIVGVNREGIVFVHHKLQSSFLQLFTKTPQLFIVLSNARMCLANLVPRMVVTLSRVLKLH